MLTTMSNTLLPVDFGDAQRDPDDERVLIIGGRTCARVTVQALTPHVMRAAALASTRPRHFTNMSVLGSTMSVERGLARRHGGLSEEI